MKTTVCCSDSRVQCDACKSRRNLTAVRMLAAPKPVETSEAPCPAFSALTDAIRGRRSTLATVKARHVPVTLPRPDPPTETTLTIDHDAYAAPPPPARLRDALKARHERRIR